MGGGGNGQEVEPKMILLLSFFRKNNKKIFFSFSMGWKLSTKNSSSPSLRGRSLFHKNFLLLPVKKKRRKIPILLLLRGGVFIFNDKFLLFLSKKEEKLK